jgi:hypothetical protein
MADTADIADTTEIHFRYTSVGIGETPKVVLIKRSASYPPSTGAVLHEKKPSKKMGKIVVSKY